MFQRGQGRRRQVQLTFNLARRQVLQRYRESMFGLVWTLMNPLILLLIYGFVFSQVFKSRWVGEVGDEPYALLIFSGLMIFNFLSETLNGSSSLVQSNSLLVKRTTVSPRLLPYALTLSTLFTFAINSLAFLIMYVWLNRRLPSPYAIQLYVLIFAVAIFATGVGMIISAISAYFRDVQQIVPLLTTALLFFSPVFFPLESLPDGIERVVRLFNPLSYPIDQSKRVLFLERWISFSGLGIYALGSLIVWVVGSKVYKVAARGFADVV
jgi:lipopolysaccharide transport system permease protein